MHTHALRPRKRARVPRDATPPVDSDRVLIACFDQPNNPIETSRRLMSEHSCRIAKILEHDRPVAHEKGIPVYLSGPVTTRAVLINMIRALSVGEVVLSQDVTLHEVLASLAYEGIAVRESGAPIGRARDGPQLDPPSRGLVHLTNRHKDEMPMHTEMKRVAHQVALAIVCWPRLESGLTAAVEGRSGQVGVAGSGGGSLGFSASATRTWIMFLPTPTSDRVSRSTDATHVARLCQRWPRWLSTFIVVFEIVHARLVRLEPSSEDEFSEKLFKKTQFEMERDPLGVFAVHRFDAPSSDGQAMSSLRREIHIARTNSQVLRATASDTEVEGAPETTTKRAWARAVVLYAESVTLRTPDLYTHMNLLFTDEAGNSDERDYLKSALGKFGVTLVRWTNHRNPSSGAGSMTGSFADMSNDALCFPFNFTNKDLQRHPDNAPCVLLAVAPQHGDQAK